MENPKDSLAREIRLFLEQNGIDPFYAVTVFGLLIVLSYRKDIQDWDELAGWRKSIIASTIFGVCILCIISILRLAGVIVL